MIPVILERSTYQEKATIGRLFIKDRFFYTFELPYLRNIQNKSCIPEGLYVAKWGDSPKYGDRYELQNVESRTNILIHQGNVAADTKGCILLGLDYGMLGGELAVLSSKAAMKEFKTLTKGEDLLVSIQERRR